MLVGVGLAARLVQKYRKAGRKRKSLPHTFFKYVLPLIEDGKIEDGPTLGSHRLVGTYRGLPAQVQFVVDTLAVRKLPSLWLMVTIPEPLPIKATFDLMMRPAGPTTFSNFESLPVSVNRPAHFPEHAAVRTDDPDNMIPIAVIEPHLEPFYGPSAKELLVTPKGVRMVSQVAQADRARYGVLRQADFGEIELNPEFLSDTLNRLLAVRQSVLNWSAGTT